MVKPRSLRSSAADISAVLARGESVGQFAEDRNNH